MKVSIQHFRLFRAICLIFGGSCLVTPADAQGTTDLEYALMWDEDTDSRDLERGLALRRLIDQGYLRATPERRVDYTDYRLPAARLTFMDTEVLMVTEEYAGEWVGCCPAPGIGVVLAPSTALAEIASFAAQNRCTLQDNQDFSEDFDQLAGRKGLSYLQCLDVPYE